MAGMVKKPWNYAYSSVHTHLSGHGNLGIVKVNRRLDLMVNTMVMDIFHRRKHDQCLLINVFYL
jgi:hypothetical protein